MVLRRTTFYHIGSVCENRTKAQSECDGGKAGTRLVLFWDVFSKPQVRLLHRAAESHQPFSSKDLL